MIFFECFVYLQLFVGFVDVQNFDDGWVCVVYFMEGGSSFFQCIVFFVGGDQNQFGGFVGKDVFQGWLKFLWMVVNCWDNNCDIV